MSVKIADIMAVPASPGGWRKVNGLWVKLGDEVTLGDEVKLGDGVTLGD